MVPLASLVDTAFLGHLAEIRHLAGVALATVLFNYIYWSFGFLRMGTTGTTAFAAGRRDKDTVILTLLRNSLIALSIGIVILLVQQPLQKIGFAILAAAPEVKQAGFDYYNALIWGAPATLVNFVLIGWFLGQEQGAVVLLLSAISNLTNIFLDYSFIVSWGLGSSGAGSATAISQYLTMLASLILVIQAFPLKKFPALTRKIFDKQALLSTFVLNRDILIRTLALISTFAVFTNLSSTLGTAFLAANTLLLQVVSLAAYFIDGLAFATESIAGKSLGQGAFEQLLPLLKLSGTISLVLGVLGAIVFSLIPDFWFGLLTNHADVIAQIKHYVLWLFPVLGFGSIAYMLDGYFLGLTEGMILRQSTLMAAIIGFAPLAVAAKHFQSNHLLWLALSLFMAARVLTLGTQVPKTLKKLAYPVRNPTSLPPGT